MKMAELGQGEDGPLKINIERLVETRLLIQANSGGGKSWLIRKLLESTHGYVQHIVLDMEGEFGTLREKYDYILAGKGGDIPADVRSAELLARKILELNTSLIVDLYELKHHERIRFVKLFLDALINAPKTLWHPVLVVIDEAHVFAPEKGQSEAMGSVIDLATRGRKRGFAAVLATQRLSKLHKDVAAECNNKLIGRTGLDIDMKRASEELGFHTKEQTLSLRDLEPGEFYAFGPALTKGVVKALVGKVETKHPKAGQRLKSMTPAPTGNVKKILEKLTDLPQQAEEEMRDKQSMLTRIRDLERELKTAAKQAPDPALLSKTYEDGVKEGIRSMRETVAECLKFLKILRPISEKIEPLMAALEGLEILKKQPPPPPTRVTPIIPLRTPSAPVEQGDRTFGRCERAILQFLAMREGRSFSKSQIGAMTGYSHGSGGFNNALSNLSSSGLITRRSDSIQINLDEIHKIQDILGSDYKAGDPHSLEEWLNKLGKCERNIYQKLLETPDEEWSKDQLGQETGYSSNSGGFNNALSRLCTLGLAERSGGQVRLNPQVRNI
jgi:hypothetical protein